MTDDPINNDPAAELEPPTKGRAGIGAVAAISAIKKPEVATVAKWTAVGVGIGSAALVAALLYTRQRGKSDDGKGSN
jgi:hypothetical protein